MSEPVGEKHGIKVYATNPSVPLKDELARSRKSQIGAEHRGLVIDDGSGEILGRGTAIAYELEEVDRDRFVKLFLTGLKAATGLSRAGMSVFELVYNAVRERPGQDTVQLSLVTSGLTKSTYYNGIRELLERQFLFRTPYDGTFFINVRYMFNGDRLAFVKAYHLKGAKPKLEQLSLLPPDEIAD
jgi:hypothetical protein